MIMPLKTDSPTIDRICTMLGDGKIVALPTDTIYGFAVDAQNKKAVEELACLKGRETKPFVLFIAKDRISHYVKIVNERIIERFLPGALTVILKKRSGIELPRSGETIGIRVPDMPFILKLLDMYEHPIAVTSANRSGENPLTSPFEIAEHFTDIPLVINGGTLLSDPSTVIDCTCTPPVITRKGVIPIQSIEDAYHEFVRISAGIRFNVLFVCTGNSCRSPMAEAILRTFVQPDHCEVRSAGTLPGFGMPASEHAKTVVRDFRGTLAGHQSQPVTPALIMWADAIFVMARKHLEYVRQLVPAVKMKVSLLKEYKQKTRNPEIEDPVGLDIDAYRKTAEEMLPFLRAIARDIEYRYKGSA